MTRDHTKWSFDILLEVVQGPLLNPRRLEEALRASKFVRRLLSFFHPMNHRFSDIKKTKVHTHVLLFDHRIRSPYCPVMWHLTSRAVSRSLIAHSYLNHLMFLLSQPNQRYVQLGCAVLSTLLANTEGVAFLAADKLLPQLFECFAEIDYVCPPLPPSFPSDSDCS